MTLTVPQCHAKKKKKKKKQLADEKIESYGQPIYPYSDQGFAVLTSLDSIDSNRGKKNWLQLIWME